MPINICVCLIHMYRQMYMSKPSQCLYLVYGKAQDLQKMTGKSSILDWEQFSTEQIPPKVLSTQGSLSKD